MGMNTTPETELQTAVQAVFEAGGRLQQEAPGLAVRAGQVQMARAVAATVEQGGALVVEAATGVGKTFAYLVPALLSGQRVLVSTATKALQDQLFERDLPWLAQALGVPVRRALLKGRSSYLCLHRMAQAESSLPVDAPVLRQQLAQVERWAGATQTGDLAEMQGLDEDAGILPWVTSTRENCLGADCPFFRECWVNRARRGAMAADVVVINHHLFFADLAIRESGVAELLPSVRVVIFDEAHKLNQVGVQFLGQQLGTGQLRDYARDLKLAGLQQARGLGDWRKLADTVELAALRWRALAGRQGRGGQRRIAWSAAAPDGLGDSAWRQALDEMADALAQALAALQPVAETAPELLRMRDRAAELQQVLVGFAGPVQPGRVRWVDVGPSLRLVESPLDIADTVRKRLLGQGEPAQEASDEPATEAPDTSEEARRRAWVFVSATLGDDERLSWFTRSCGLEEADVLRIASPFDYRQQAALYVPAAFPLPGTDAHGQQVARLAATAAQTLGGRTLVLTTTRRALRQIAEALAQHFVGATDIEVLAQGQAPKRVLMARLRDATAPGRRGCVLVASASFWEGVDVPGDALQLVVIDKLPFPPPGDPLVQARSQRLEAAGQSPFARYFLPAAAVALKQGAGRLIRGETDKGMIAICDPRLTRKGYGRRLLRALPDMALLQSAAAFDEALRRLAAAHDGNGADVDAPEGVVGRPA